MKVRTITIKKTKVACSAQSGNAVLKTSLIRLAWGENVTIATIIPAT